jgi:CxxC-x17-CxxC domain-containing protein
MAQEAPADQPYVSPRPNSNFGGGRYSYPSGPDTRPQRPTVSPGFVSAPQRSFAASPGSGQPAAPVFSAPQPQNQPDQTAPQRTIYRTVCATCDTEIEVPFKPDGQRPTFCKEHLKDYQRAVSKVRNDDAPQRPMPEAPRAPRQFSPQSRMAPSERFDNKNVQMKTYVPGEKPLSLSQMGHIAPKKFKPAKQKAAPDLEELRKLIRDERKTE